VLAQKYHYIDPIVLFEAMGADLESFRDLSRIFLNIGPPMLGLLKQAILTGDCKDVAYESHSLKGTTSLVGATELTRVLQEIENLSRSGDIASIEPHIAELTRLFDIVMQEVQTSLVHFHGYSDNRNSAQA
jgi:HPt (histidine-containing phosphotransfer) domain-containing protein